jgi:hypothetical protein
VLDELSKASRSLMRVTAPADKRFRRAHTEAWPEASGLGSWRWRAVAAAALLGLAGYTRSAVLAGMAEMPVFPRPADCGPR